MDFDPTMYFGSGNSGGEQDFEPTATALRQWEEMRAATRRSLPIRGPNVSERLFGTI